MKERSYSATIHAAHLSFSVWLIKLATLYDDGLIDYAAVSLEKSKAGKKHLQAFIVFNESANLSKEKKPTDVIEGSFQKSRSLTGNRDYCMAQGIHYRKHGVIRIYEFGEWVDAGYNINIKFRKQYQFSEQLRDGLTPTDLAKLDPAGVLIVGLKNLMEINAAIHNGVMNVHGYPNEPYYYIGLEHLQKHLKIDSDAFDMDEEE